jgi:hypothetical protein
VDKERDRGNRHNHDRGERVYLKAHGSLECPGRNPLVNVDIQRCSAKHLGEHPEREQPGRTDRGRPDVSGDLPESAAQKPVDRGPGKRDQNDEYDGVEH